MVCIKQNSLPIFFIMGRPRSGTTLLSTLFDAHPNVKIPPEYPVFLFVYQKFRKVKTWDNAKIISFVDHVFLNHTFNNLTLDNLKINREAFIAELTTLSYKGTIQDFLKKINQQAFSVFPKQEILQIGDKNPIYSIYTKRFLKIFPEAKFICIIRDYRDNYLSMRKLSGLKLEAPVLSLQVARWRFVARLFLECKKKHPARFHIVRYEDLVTDQENVMRELCSFIGISYNPSVFDFFKMKDEAMKFYPREIFEKFHQSLMNPVNTGRMNLWKKQLDEKQVRVADQIAGKTADVLGYDRREKRFSMAVYLISLPMVIYAIFLFRVMQLGSYLPYNSTRWLSRKILMLAGFYRRFSGRKSMPYQEK